MSSIISFFRQVVRIFGVECSRCFQTVMLSFPGGPGGLALRPLTLLPNGELLVSCRDYVATLASLPPGQLLSRDSSQHLSQTAREAALIGDLEGSDRDEGCAADSDDNGDLVKNASIMSSDEKKERERMRSLIRQGAAFCCLDLQEVRPPTLPPDLPLPPRLAALGLTPDDPVALLTHLPPSTLASGLTAGAAPSMGLLGPPASRLASRRPAASRPASAVRRQPPTKSSGKSWKDSPAPPNSGRHLSPGWRPHSPRPL